MPQSANHLEDYYRDPDLEAWMNELREMAIRYFGYDERTCKCLKAEAFIEDYRSGAAPVIAMQLRDREARRAV